MNRKTTFLRNYTVLILAILFGSMIFPGMPKGSYFQESVERLQFAFKMPGNIFAFIAAVFVFITAGYVRERKKIISVLYAATSILYAFAIIFLLSGEQANRPVVAGFFALFLWFSFVTNISINSFYMSLYAYEFPRENQGIVLGSVVSLINLVFVAHLFFEDVASAAANPAWELVQVGIGCLLVLIASLLILRFNETRMWEKSDVKNNLKGTWNFLKKTPYLWGIVILFICNLLIRNSQVHADFIIQKWGSLGSAFYSEDMRIANIILVITPFLIGFLTDAFGIKHVFRWLMWLAMGYALLVIIAIFGFMPPIVLDCVQSISAGTSTALILIFLALCRTGDVVPLFAVYSLLTIIAQGLIGPYFIRILELVPRISVFICLIFVPMLALLVFEWLIHKKKQEVQTIHVSESSRIQELETGEKPA